MQYFNSLPLVSQNTYSAYNNNQLVTNLLTRAYLLPSLLNNVMLFYDYEVRDGDTIESVAYNYYNDVYKYWIICYSNNIIDPLFDWPKTSSQFELYLEDKYSQEANGVPVIAYTMSTIHHYEKTISVINDFDFANTVTTIWIDEDTYDSLMPSIIERTFPSGTNITQKITKQAVSIYTYESIINDNKRKIKLLKDDYVPDIENRFKKLMQQYD